MHLVKICFVLLHSVLAGFTTRRIRLQLYCINKLTILILILQNWKQMNKFHNPFMANNLLLWIYRQLLKLNNILTEDKQIFYSKIKYITNSGYVKLKTLYQTLTVKSWNIMRTESFILSRNEQRSVYSTTTELTSPNSLQKVTSA